MVSWPETRHLTSHTLRVDRSVVARLKVIADVAAERPVTITPALLWAAMDLHRTDTLSFRDARIVRAATPDTCDALYSQDLQGGSGFDRTRVVIALT